MVVLGKASNGRVEREFEALADTVIVFIDYRWCLQYFSSFKIVMLDV